MKKLNASEKRVYDCIAQSIALRGYAPSVRDLCDALGYKSTSTVHLYLRRLEELGYIYKEDGKSRAIQLVSTKRSLRKGIPVLGKVTAGIPILAEENFDGYIDFGPDETKHDANSLFALKIVGASMQNVGIMDGDYAIVEKGEYAENGDIVVAMIEDEATVKTFYKENGGFRLQPENSAFSPIFVKELFILGKVIATVRYY